MNRTFILRLLSIDDAEPVPNRSTPNLEIQEKPQLPRIVAYAVLVSLEHLPYPRLVK
jgi:hypothetical protein